MRPVTGADGRPHYLIGLEFLSMPAALFAQIEAWMSGGQQIAAGGV
ncbi:MAG: hypothetical protein H0U19_12335 [Acidobacteria bacterium]|nr:hypothetical protein [Acidobacteriota bacterium]